MNFILFLGILYLTPRRRTSLLVVIEAQQFGRIRIKNQLTTKQYIQMHVSERFSPKVIHWSPLYTEKFHTDVIKTVRWSRIQRIYVTFAKNAKIRLTFHIMYHCIHIQTRTHTHTHSLYYISFCSLVLIYFIGVKFKNSTI